MSHFLSSVFFFRASSTWWWSSGLCIVLVQVVEIAIACWQCTIYLYHISCAMLYALVLVLWWILWSEHVELLELAHTFCLPSLSLTGLLLSVVLHTFYFKIIASFDSFILFINWIIYHRTFGVLQTFCFVLCFFVWLASFFYAVIILRICDFVNTFLASFRLTRKPYPFILVFWPFTVKTSDFYRFCRVLFLSTICQCCIGYFSILYFNVFRFTFLPSDAEHSAFTFCHFWLLFVMINLVFFCVLHDDHFALNSHRFLFWHRSLFEVFCKYCFYAVLNAVNMSSEAAHHSSAEHVF